MSVAKWRDSRDHQITITTTQPPEESAFLVFVNPDEEDDRYEEEELTGLCEAAHLRVLGMMRQRLVRLHTGTAIGKGKVEELAAHIADTGAEIALFDCELSGIQMRNLSEALKCRVVDRTQLILDIFATRAKTREGQLQVELAQLTYMMPRLMSVYTKFERQKGGIGMRGPGETKLESDRRMVKDRIAKLKSEIEEIKQHRDLQRASRRKHPFPFATLVGYTSAGKSTLMNRLSGTRLLADAMPFATLDPTTRKVDLPDGYSLFLTDTVGFIRNLPTHLVAAFRSTLEEVTEADLIIHMIDVSLPEWDIQRDAVLETLDNLSALGKPTLTVFNKLDLIEDEGLLGELLKEWPDSVAISAATGQGIDELLHAIVQLVKRHLGVIEALLPYSENALVDECYRFGRVHAVEYQEGGIYIKAELVSEMRSRLGKFQLGKKQS